jgi:hypothetical protein
MGPCPLYKLANHGYWKKVMAFNDRKYRVLAIGDIDRGKHGIVALIAKLRDPIVLTVI